MRTSGFLSPASGGARGWVLLLGMVGAAALALCPASPSVYPGKAKVQSLADTTPPLELGSPSCCELVPPHVRGVPALPRSAHDPKALLLSGLRVCVVVGLGGMTHFSTLSRHLPSAGSLTQMIQILLNPVTLSLVICSASQLCIIC